KPIFEYTLMPVHSTSLFEVRELEHAELVRGFDFTKGAPLLKVPALQDAKRPPMQGGGYADTRTRLFDLSVDPRQQNPFRSQEVEARLNDGLCREMQSHEVPAEVFARFSL
ncbi:MAG: sulfatase, partial [Boseongicola sp.]|nr:sulfatase [Boseongicola sp.]